MRGFFTQKWAFAPCVLALSVASVFYFGVVGTYWAVTGEFTRWGASLLNLFGVDTNKLGYFKIIGLKGNIFERIDGVMILGMFCGMLCASSLSGRVGFNLPTKAQMGRSLLGGLLAGLGARLGLGCNLASFLTGIPQFSLHAWFFTAATLVGMGLAFRHFSTSCSKGATKQAPARLNALLAFCAVGGFGVLAWHLHHKLFYALCFGAFFGLVISKGQICFTAAFRHLFVQKQSAQAKALVWAMAVGSVGIFVCLHLGLHAKTLWASPGIAVGGLLFGVGIVLAGGCECGWMYRSMQGDLGAVMVGVGNVLGAALVALSWDFYAPFWVNFAKVNLLEFRGGLLLQALLLAGLWGVVWGVGRSPTKN
ncbi:selenium metabolism membrane protein YedE/FdhT [Helicobacter sp. NHP22-001]|uniref:selenium metabolism membrane protein YedE/FdhT n=1 Tax=Helicobacter sp. NHP22-001 TaxID=3040202 RepID=UPI00244D7DED|nr:selenium metabolism membrane protein YedE/FdhT [Helicobacter sp. NHP22-001]GMB96556.1 selenium metabolism membrane protein YedE/FdhT [Helicobacter sp. NHP22-001]